MTLEEIKNNCDRAEQDGGINFDELSFETLAEWVRLNPRQESSFTEDFDVVSVSNMLEQWWIDQQE
jgi:hypothetical protein